jgi:hypothetical protein
MDITIYRLDKSAFEALSFDEADKQMNSSEGLTWHESIMHFNYLMSVSFGFLGKEWPRMDKTHFQKLKRA